MLFTAFASIVAVAAMAVRTVQAQQATDAPQAAHGDDLIILQDAPVRSVVEKMVVDFSAFSHGNTFGVEVTPAGGALRSQLGIEGDAGVVITSVAPKTAAETAGLKSHDIILKVDADSIGSAERFHELIGSRRGENATLYLMRQGKPLELEAEIPDVPVYNIAENFAELEFVVDPAYRRYRIGVTLAEADDTLRRQLKLAAGEGLVVTEVVDDGPASKADLRQDDVLVKLDGKRLTTVASINEQIQEIKDRKVTVDFIRGGEESSVELTPQLSSESPWKRKVLLAEPAVQDYLILESVFRNRVNWAGSLPSQKTGSDALPEQLARLKQQIAEMQRTIEALEASLRSSGDEQQPASPTDKEADEK